MSLFEPTLAYLAQTESGRCLVSGLSILYISNKRNRRHRGLFHVPLSALKQRSISGRLRTARRRMQAEQNI
ncbi:hypothetical protein KC334_g50 [Hortaea werneckii]|nr:hypothetical protein KC334_g50 [Hortaea werneckii]